MNKKHRKILAELQSVCNSLGSTLDYTATHVSKLKDRQRAHALVSDVLFGVLVDHPENDYKEDDMRKAEIALVELRKLERKTYTDSSGYIKDEEKHLLNKNS